jgi:peptide/nickel transport system permease protein
VSAVAFKRNGLGVLGLTLAGLAVLAALAAPLLAPHDPVKGDFSQGLKPPGTPGHPLGTDQLGRDTLSRVLYGARVALFIGLCTVLLTAIVGGLLGLLAGFFGGWPGQALMRLCDVQLSFPFILLALTINAIVGLGLSIIIVASLQFSQFIVAEAAISFLGFGVQPPTPAWGSMLSESRDFLYVAWWLAAFPGAALALTALGVNLVGDWLRDVLDPKFRV